MSKVDSAGYSLGPVSNGGMDPRNSTEPAWFTQLSASQLVEARKLWAALKAAKRLNDEALPKFNWGASALDSNAIILLNEVPGIINRALEIK